ncbi:peptidoglycan DD-metalloendopeptidase family protein [Streptomyces sp. NPDC048650]|uniref:M23 family metallopeptidase n=1 Tax=unclassified Streptomyces TaxID=2593676 RepID=UPI003712D9D5
MNNRHPSGYPAYDSYGQQHSASGYGEYGDGDPLFGSLPGSYETGQYDAGGYGSGSGSYDTGAYDAHSYDPNTYGTGGYDTGGPHGDGYGTPTYGTGTWETGAYDGAGYGTAGYATTGTYSADGQAAGGYDAVAYATGTYESGAYETGAHETGAYETGTYEGYDPYAHTAYGHAGHDPYPQQHQEQEQYQEQYQEYAQYEPYGAEAPVAHDAEAFGGGHVTDGHEATAIWSTTDQGLIAGIPAQAGPSSYETTEFDASEFRTEEFRAEEVRAAGPEAAASETAEFGAVGFEADAPVGPEVTDEAAAVADAMTQAMPVTAPAPSPRRVAGPAPGKPVRGRGRRRTAKRSALLTVAVPSVAVMGVCAAAAASVTGFVGDDKNDEATAKAAADTGSVKAATANKKLDTQLAGLSADARDFGDRANRTQERIDLKERQALEKKRAAAEAARKEALRPKFVLPVTQHGLSALFGQAGVNWMSVHTGIDFPVSYGTPVMAATDGTVRTQWNSAYGNMAIVTAPDGTETWYCHLSSTKIRSGSVKAGDQIAYSGNSGNSTGPHLHFEVRPGGDAAINPLPWLRSHGLDPD